MAFMLKDDSSAEDIKVMYPYAILLFSLLLFNIRRTKIGKYLSPIGCFILCWFIVGNVWIFGTKEHDCDSLVWKTGFWYLIASCILISNNRKNK